MKLSVTFSMNMSTKDLKMGLLQQCSTLNSFSVNSEIQVIVVPAEPNVFTLYS